MKLKHLITPFIMPSLVVACVIICIVWLTQVVNHSSMAIVVDDRIDNTAQYVESVKAIGQWEFLTIEGEELTDTVRKGIISDDRLVRIYYGTLRIGTDLSSITEGDILVSGDSITLSLPKVKLLDNDFIDEARSKNFYESGRWSHADRELLFQKARRQMLRRHLTSQVLLNAQSNGEQQLRQLTHAWGFKNVTIKWK